MPLNILARSFQWGRRKLDIDIEAEADKMRIRNIYVELPFDILHYIKFVEISCIQSIFSSHI
jgi:7,8-dihydro-6-hydroxymethylpterin-pyrophosphokinase